MESVKKSSLKDFFVVVRLFQLAMISFVKFQEERLAVQRLKFSFSQNMHWRVRKEISNSLRFQRTNDLGKYLGIKLHHKKVSTRSDHDSHVVDKVQQRLSAWKARTLSFADRLTLTKLILSSLPLYSM